MSNVYNLNNQNKAKNLRNKVKSKNKLSLLFQNN